MMNQIVVELSLNHPVQEKGHYRNNNQVLKFTVSELQIEAKSIKSENNKGGCQIDSHVILLFTVKRMTGD